MNGRRRRLDEPFNPFAVDAASIRQRNRQQRIGHRHIVGKINDIIISKSEQIEQVEQVRTDIEKLKSRQAVKTEFIVLENISSLATQIGEELNKLESNINSKLEEEIARKKKSLKNIAEKENIDLTKDVWKHKSTAIPAREIDIMIYEQNKHENNNFLDAFEINSLHGKYIRGLSLINSYLTSSSRVKHIGDGLILSFKEGVRVLFDTKKTIKSSLDGSRKVWVYIGLEKKLVCVERAKENNTPGPDWIAAMVMIANSNWPKQMTPFTINLEVDSIKSPNINLITEIVKQHYSLNQELIQGIEVYDWKNLVKIMINDNKKTGLFIGKKGKETKDLRDTLHAQTNKKYNIEIWSCE